ncbi:MAG: hypothetical protein HC852_09745 [Acaryochloridaceae cyanobacterium RU_4_10]|nr:hypothetical protein [Acaryochloridaceae cyanobacterium RU_4_10]
MRLIALTATPLLASTAIATIHPAPLRAQSASPSSFSLPESLPQDTTVKVDGSSSMSQINAALQKRFQEKFAGSNINLASGGTDEALKALIKGDVDLAAVGRSLTDAEKKEGLVAVPLSREKIAIIVGPENPFKGSLTFAQFAKIFRGEITDWSEVGGTGGKIRFVDRPDFSDTRWALSRYKVFKEANFETGANATQVDRDDTSEVVKALGTDGISYAIASQVMGQDNVRVLAMHDTLPDNPQYPFSQPRGYVYKGTPNPGVQAFLGFATSEAGQGVIANAKKHGLDFMDAKCIFDDDTVTIEDDRFGYGEQRFISLGLLQNCVIAIVHTENKDTIRIISARRATRNEERSYFEQFTN